MVWACIKINLEGNKKIIKKMIFLIFWGFLFLLAEFRDAFWMNFDEILMICDEHFVVVDEIFQIAL